MGEHRGATCQLQNRGELGIHYGNTSKVPSCLARPSHKATDGWLMELGTGQYLPSRHMMNGSPLFRRCRPHDDSPLPPIFRMPQLYSVNALRASLNETWNTPHTHTPHTPHTKTHLTNSHKLDECTCFCKPIKGQSKTTKTYFCRFIHKNHTYWGKNLDRY